MSYTLSPCETHRTGSSGPSSGAMKKERKFDNNNNDDDRNEPFHVQSNLLYCVNQNAL